MVAVKSADQAPVPGSPRTPNVWAFSSAAAVLIIVILAPAFLRPERPTSPSEVIAPRAEKFALTTPPVRATLVSWGRQESALEADLGPTQLAGLDHDARVAAHYVLDPLSLPAPRR